MLGGTVLVETVFDWPGIGLYAVNSAVSSDFQPIMGVTLLIGLNFMLANLAVDLAYGWLRPRLRAGTAGGRGAGARAAAPAARRLARGASERRARARLLRPHVRAQRLVHARARARARVPAGRPLGPWVVAFPGGGRRRVELGAK